jgi:hypothetical protein
LDLKIDALSLLQDTLKKND